MKKKKQQNDSFSSKSEKIPKVPKKHPVSNKKSQVINQKKRQKIQKKGKNAKKIQNKHYSVKLIARDALLALIGGMVLTAFVLSFFLAIIKVNGFGMMPILKDQEMVLVEKNGAVKRFDVIVFSRGNKLEMRRVIGLPGERIRYDKDTLLVNDEAITEKFIVDEINESQKNGKNFTEDFSTGGQELSKDMYLVLGDNRPYATDSRHYGLIHQEKILGVIKMKIWPVGYL